MDNAKMAKLNELLEDEQIVAQLRDAGKSDTADDMLSVLKEHGLVVTEDELLEMGYALAGSDTEAGELDEASLENVAGGTRLIDILRRLIPPRGWPRPRPRPFPRGPKRKW